MARRSSIVASAGSKKVADANPYSHELLSVTTELFDPDYVAFHVEGDIDRPVVPSLNVVPQAFQLYNQDPSPADIKESVNTVVDELRQSVWMLGTDYNPQEFDKIIEVRNVFLSKMRTYIYRQIDLARNEAGSSQTRLAENNPLPVGFSMAIRATVRMLLVLAQASAQDLTLDTLEIVTDVLSMAPPLALANGPGFHPDIAEGLRPLTEFVIEATLHEDAKIRDKALECLFWMSLARC
jgi:hypothetical protein